MFHPVGSQPPSVYWRRRLVLLGSIGLVLVLLVLTVKIATSDGSEPATQAGGGQTRPPAQTTPAANTSHSTSTTPRERHSTSAATTSSAKSSPTAPAPCAAKDLQVAAVSSKARFSVGDEPVLELQVTNTGDAPCVQDLADSQVVLKVYNGESRVWGSHDCQVQPGTNPMTLEVGQPVRVSVTWSGLSSQPGCAGTRQRVGAGTYTLYAALSGHTGKATTFTIS
jgi:cytoskeletal protein RodZ